MGCLYAGFPRRAAALILFFPLADIVTGLLMVAIPVRVANVAVPLALLLALRAGLAMTAARRARGRDPGMPVRWYSRWYAVIAAAIVAAVVNAAWAGLMRGTFVHAFAHPSGSMEPALLRGDRVLADMWSYGWRMPGGTILGPRRPDRGRLVVFRYPEDPSVDMLKRVIGLPGEMVEVRGERVLVDGKPLAESYARFTEHDDGSRTWGPKKVPPDHYFVLGDDRDNSKDSRHWGFIPQSELKGRVRLVYWSRDPATGELRWERMGLLLP